MPIPESPKLYHIVHVDRLQSIINDGYLWCDAEVLARSSAGSTIGMNSIKKRRLEELSLDSHPDLYVGECTPFYFCPRSVMLYLIHCANHPELDFRGGQSRIVHLEADMLQVIEWAEKNARRWAFTLSNAGARYFEDRCDLDNLGDIEWNAVQARDWRSCKEGKQAEFLVERGLPWELINRIGVSSITIRNEVNTIIDGASHSLDVESIPTWYY